MQNNNILPEDLRLLPPLPGACPECATMHGKDEPHDVRSLWYQMRFYREHGRFARIADTVRDLSEEALTEIAKGMMLPKKEGFWVEKIDDWTRKCERLPEREDADEQGCVLCWHIYDGVIISNYKMIQSNRFIACWRKMVDPPIDADILLKSLESAIEAKYPSPRGWKRKP